MADETGGGIYEKTMNLRFVRRFENVNSIDRLGNLAAIGHRPIRVLQQAWVCGETGEFDWRDVELVEDV